MANNSPPANRWLVASEEMEAHIVKIAAAGSPNQVIKPDLEDDQKRWLVVGICLHSIISPTMRQYVSPIVNTLYNALKQSDNIHTQSFQQHMKKYLPTKTELNYEAINGNKAVRSVRLRDYKVQNAVDLSKLFMLTSMAQYTGFDDTCDSSALLGILININKFPPVVHTVAEKIRSDVRNPWAHCDFSEWNTNKYQTSFQLMHQFIRNLRLNHAEETRVLGELLKWENNGLYFLQGTTIGLEVLQDIRTQTSSLAEYALTMPSKTDSSFQNIYTQLVDIQKEITTVFDKVVKLEIEQKQQQTSIMAACGDIDNLKEKTTNIESKQETDKELLENLGSEIAKSTDALKQVSIDSSLAQDKIKLLEKNYESAAEDVTQIKGDIDTMKGGIEEIKKYTSHFRPNGKVFFYPPNRINSFVGREDELQQLEHKFVKSPNDQHTQAICGLGGCGKTTLSIEFAWVTQAFYPGGVFWMSAESNAALEDSVTQLAIDVNAVGKDSKETLHQTLRWISQLKQRWLLVIDNVDEEDISGNMKELLLGAWKRNSLGHFVITSRRDASEIDESLDVSSNNCIRLEIFTQHEGIVFMKRRTGRGKTDADDEHIATLVEELGGLPLALEQAAAHIKSLKCTFNDYTVKFKKKRLKLLRGAKSSFEINKERLAVRTTWQLNIDYIHKQSDEEGLGTAAVTVMQISSFFFADDIPVVVINSGEPQVDDSDLSEALEDQVGVDQVIEVLTRFSLFQRDGNVTLSVHRLVQEVIRESITDTGQLRSLFQCATRMINKALSAATSPYDALNIEKGNAFKRGSLHLWSTLAANANVLKAHLIKFSSVKDKDVCFNAETAKLLQTTAIYHSIYQRQDEALADQDQMLNIITTLDISKEEYKELTCIKIPLLDNDRSRIQNSIACALREQQQENDGGKALVPFNSETLRLMGNEAFKEKRFHDAITYYTESLRACSDGQLDAKALSNRSLLYLKIHDYENALLDANKCIELAPDQFKGYCWKAYSIFNLIRIGKLPSTMEAVGLASACMAANMNKDCLLEYKMKIYYPVVVYKMIDNPNDLAQEISSIVDRPFTTLMLRKGRYCLNRHDQVNMTFTTKSIQVFGIENGVEIDTGQGLPMICPPSELFRIHFEPERKIHIHFENVFFPSEGGQISVGTNVVASFYRCKFSNGKKGCDGFPKCTGGLGCVNVVPGDCKRKHDTNKKKEIFANAASGLVGGPGVVAFEGGKVLIDTCVFDRCGGGGVLSDGDGSLCEVKNSTLCNMRQTGVEARNGGTIHAVSNVIIDNQHHGIAIGPRGTGMISENAILRNGHEGIWSGGTVNNFVMNVTDGSTAVIVDNIISQNGLSGLSFDCGSFKVSGNKIFDNWLWGMMIKSRSATHVLNNDIFENKCGGIRIGINYSASVILDGNTIRDHSGPGIHIMKIPENLLTLKEPGSDESGVYTKTPIFTNRNVVQNNNKGVQHPMTAVQLIQTCSGCHEQSSKLMKCGKCKIATYCSKECQTKHWLRHKHMCKLLQESYTIEIQMKDTKPSFQDHFDESETKIRMFNSKLIGIAEGPPPDRHISKKFIVKVQSGKEYGKYDPKKDISVYDRSVTLPGCLDIDVSNPELYHLVNECGILAGEIVSTKKIFCWASFKQKGKVLCIHTDNLPPFQTW